MPLFKTTRVDILFFILMTLLAGCAGESSPQAPTLTISATKTQLIPPTRTTIPASPINPGFLPELGGSRAWIEKVMKLQGFQFSPPSKDGTKEFGYGSLLLDKEGGDPFDLEIIINTTSSDYSLIRAQMQVLAPRPLDDPEMELVLELMHLFWIASIPDWEDGTGWIDSTLPKLESFEGQVARTSKEEFQVKLSAGPWISSGADGWGYILTLWVDPVPVEIGQTSHISVEAITPLRDMDSLSLSCSDYEDPETVTWRTSPACVPNCTTGNPNVIVSNNKITVFEGFPVTYDQWTIKVELDDWRETQYPPYGFKLEVIFHETAYSCTNSQPFNWNEHMGEAVIWVEIVDGEQHLYSDDPVGMICQEK